MILRKNSVSNLVSSDQIVAIAAEKSSIDTVWFVYVNEIDCVNHTCQQKDDYGHVIPTSQSYLSCNYLEKQSDKKKGVVYKRSNKNVFIYKECIVYPLVEFEAHYNNNQDLFFLTNGHYIEILNCVQFTAMGSLF